MSKITAITMPSVIPDMSEGKIVGWLVKPGGMVEKGEPLLEVETDKAVVEYEAPVSGILRRRMAKEGATLPVGALIGIVISDSSVSEVEINEFVQSFGR
jgi:pyruvate dehydrogenase E2 component (dihydrolipoamide acetyltransferase)